MGIDSVKKGTLKNVHLPVPEGLAQLQQNYFQFIKDRI